MAQEVVANADAMATTSMQRAMSRFTASISTRVFRRSSPNPTPPSRKSQAAEEQRSLNLDVVGHTDNAGSLDSNMKLSKDRADAVVRALTVFGDSIRRRDHSAFPARGTALLDCRRGVVHLAAQAGDPLRPKRTGWPPPSPEPPARRGNGLSPLGTDGPSGIAALMVSTSPFWLVFFESFRAGAINPTGNPSSDWSSASAAYSFLSARLNSTAPVKSFTLPA